MPRATNNPASRERRRKVLKQAKGYYSGRRKLFQNANETVKRALRYAYRDRRVRKREFRVLWIARINAAVRANGLTYSQFMSGLRLAEIDINRKMLSELAIHDPAGFAEFVTLSRKALDARPKAAAATA